MKSDTSPIKGLFPITHHWGHSLITLSQLMVEGQSYRRNVPLALQFIALPHQRGSGVTVSLLFSPLPTVSGRYVFPGISVFTSDASDVVCRAGGNSLITPSRPVTAVF